MREIKFRAWDLDNGGMWYTHRDCDDGEWGKSWYFDEEKGVAFSEYMMRDICEGGEHVQKDEWHQPKQILMQYTGLKDKNGKEIYEGDVIQGWDRTDEYGSGFHYQSFVEWSDYEGMWVAVDKDLEGYVVEQFPLYDYQFDKVIGNIYENPELLKA